MKGYFRQALVFVLVFVVTASQLAGVAFAGIIGDDEKYGDYEIVLNFWRFFEFGADLDNNSGELSLLNGLVKIKSPLTTDEDADKSKEAYEQAVTKMQEDLGTSNISSTGYSITVQTVSGPVIYPVYDRLVIDSSLNKGKIINYGVEYAYNALSFFPFQFNGNSYTLTISDLRAEDTYYYSSRSYWVYKDGEMFKSTTFTHSSYPCKFLFIKDYQALKLRVFYVTGYKSHFDNNNTGGTVFNYYKWYDDTVIDSIYFPTSSDDKFLQAGNYIENSGSRAGAVTTNYGYMNEDGELIVTGDIQIINEDNHSVYNPVTGNTTTFGDWTYDYSTRTYTVNTTTGDTTTITYGDEYMTITEGDTVYNYYYVTNNNGSSTGGSSSGGNNSDNDGDDDGGVFDALGKLLSGIIDAVGSLITPVIGAIVDFLVSIADKVTQGVGAFTGLLLRLFSEIPELFTGFTSFLAAVFPFMPPEFVMLIELGILLFIVGAVIKKIFG